MREIDLVILHCSASRLPGQDAAMIREWHLARGWKDIGYHWFIGFSGLVEMGRAESVVGAHCEGKNARSVGVCLAGLEEGEFTPEQWRALAGVLAGLKRRYPKAELVGHNEFSSKLCPVFQVQHWKEFWKEL